MAAIRLFQTLASLIDVDTTGATDGMQLTFRLSDGKWIAAAASSTHTHAISDVTGLQTALDGKSATGHGHSISDVTGLQASLDGKSAAGHGHAISEISGLQATIDGKAATSHTHAISDTTGLQAALDAKAPYSRKEAIIIAASDETTALTTGTGKATFRMPYAMTLTGIRGSLTTAQPSGAVLTVDVKQGGTTILSTLLTFDNTEKTTTTATTPPVISTTALTEDAEIRIDVTQIGGSGAAGLKIALLGTRLPPD